jgi:hypothetical protein
MAPSSPPRRRNVTSARLLIAAAAALAAAGPAAAQKIAPGLWEHTITMKMSGNPQMEEAMKRMQEQLANMPPEKRKQMEEMMARQGGGGGVTAGGVAGMMSGQPTTMKVCITPEQAAKDHIPTSNGNCQQVDTQRSGKTMKVKFTCSRPDGGSMTGEGQFNMVSDKEHNGHMVMNGTGRKGEPMHMEIDQAGRWLGADCGDVKPRPYTPPPAKK